MSFVKAFADHKVGDPGGFVIVVKELEGGYALCWLFDATIGPILDMFIPGELRELTEEEVKRLPWNNPETHKKLMAVRRTAVEGVKES